jgi:hypothetical protein
MKDFWHRRPSWLFPFLLGNGLMFCVLAAVVWVGLVHRPAPKTYGVMAGLSQLGLNQDTNAAPWGLLTALEFPLADAEELEPQYTRLLGPPRWFFSSVSEKQLTRYFITSSMRYRDRHLLLDRKYWKVTTNGCEITPPESVVYALDGVNRGKIYSALARSETNTAQRSALVLPKADIEPYLLAIGLSHVEVARLQQLTYTNKGTVCISDLGIARKVLGEESFQKLVEFLYAIPAYRLTLFVPEGSDVDALAAYWGKGGREELIKPLLRSLAHVPGGADIGVSYLLPDFARLRLYRFPNAQNDPHAESEDCIYSSMNFFSKVPDTNFLDMNYVQAALTRDYEPARDVPTFGDLILLQDDAGQIVHMSVYIAGEFVFTKNGTNPSKPWALMRLDDMLAVYCGKDKNPHLQVLRPRNPGGANPAPTAQS